MIDIAGMAGPKGQPMFVIVAVEHAVDEGRIEGNAAGMAAQFENLGELPRGTDRGQTPCTHPPRKASSTSSAGADIRRERDERQEGHLELSPV